MTVAVEGPFAWEGSAGEARLATDAQKNFALGHQYHALLTGFDDIVDNVSVATDIEFGGSLHKGRSGDMPAGGTATLVNGTVPERPAGLRFEFPDGLVVDTTFDGWRRTDGQDLPFVALIDDGERVFEYRYSRVSITEESPHWFRDELPVANLDEVDVYRLHRQLLAAHCLGDADLMADLTAPESVVANRGELHTATREQTRELFSSVFDSVAYDRYIDLVDPQVRIAESGDIGWVAVNVRTVGARKSDDQAFDLQWAWIMLVEKYGGVWLNAGNASNFVDER